MWSTKRSLDPPRACDCVSLPLLHPPLPPSLSPLSLSSLCPLSLLSLSPLSLLSLSLSLLSAIHYVRIYLHIHSLLFTSSSLTIYCGVCGQVPLHPKNAALGNKTLAFTEKFLIEQGDAVQLKEGEEVSSCCVLEGRGTRLRE